MKSSSSKCAPSADCPNTVAGRDIGSDTPVRIRLRSSSERPFAFVGRLQISAEQYRADVHDFELGLRNDGDVLISCENRYAVCVALMGAWQVGRRAILPPSRRSAVIAAIRSQHKIAAECDDAWARELIQRTAATKGGHGEWCIQLNRRNIAVRLYTSGSTGEPTAVDKSVGNLFDEGAELVKAHSWPAAAVVGTVAPHHMYGLTFTVMLPLVAGLPVTDGCPLLPADIAAAIEASSAGTLISVPAQYRALLAGRTRLSGIQCVSAAAELDERTARDWLAFQQRPIREIYGSTETGIIAHRAAAPDTRWTPFPTVRLTSRNNLLTVGSPFVGTLWHQGFETADRVTLYDDGTFDLNGRADRIVKLAGRKVSLTSIENAIRRCTFVDDARVILDHQPSQVRESAIWAVVVTQNTDERQLRKALARHLNQVEIPRRFRFVTDFPRNNNGKVTEHLLRSLFAQ